MGLIKEEKLTAEFVLSKISETEIFTAYFGPFKLHEVYRSVFRKDRNPSTGFYISRTGRIKYNDFARDERLDCFAFVGKMFGLEYGSAVYKVAKDFALIGNAPASFDTEAIQRQARKVEKVQKDTKIEIVPDKWTSRYLSYWKRYYITEEELVREDVYPVKKLYINGKFIPNWQKEERYCYIIEINGDRRYKKIYTPLAKNREFKWISAIPNHVPFGINKLPHQSNQLIITKSQKDRILFQKYFPDVLGTQNESWAALNEKTRAYIDAHYDRVIFNQDLDDAGIRSAGYFVQFGYTSLFVPHIAKEKRGVKDFADFVKVYGLKKFEDFLKHKQLL